MGLEVCNSNRFEGNSQNKCMGCHMRRLRGAHVLVRTIFNYLGGAKNERRVQRIPVGVNEGLEERAFPIYYGQPTA